MTTVLAGSATTNGATIITVPAGQTWRGSVTLSAALSAAIGVGALSASPSVTVQGTGAVPASGTVLTQLTLSTPAVAALALVGLGLTDSREAGEVKVTAPAGNAVTLQLNTGSATGAAAQAHGEYGVARPAGIVNVFNGATVTGASGAVAIPEPRGRIVGQITTTSTDYAFTLEGSFDLTNWFVISQTDNSFSGSTDPVFLNNELPPFFYVRGNIPRLQNGALTANVVFAE
jgi:hypothetical protein